MALAGSPLAEGPEPVERADDFRSPIRQAQGLRQASFLHRSLLNSFSRACSTVAREIGETAPFRHQLAIGKGKSFCAKWPYNATSLAFNSSSFSTSNLEMV